MSKDLSNLSQADQTAFANLIAQVGGDKVARQSVAELAMVTHTGKVWTIDPANGSDTNPTVLAVPAYATLTNVVIQGQPAAGDIIQYVPGAVVKEVFSEYFTVPAGVKSMGSRGNRAVFQAFDPLPAGSFVKDGATTGYFADVAHTFIGYTPGARVSGNRWYMGVIYRTTLNGEWKQLERIEIGSYGTTDKASAIAYVYANPGTMYVEDLSGNNCSYSTGFLSGTYRYHVNTIDGTLPANCQWMVKQRKIPIFGPNSLIQDIEFFGDMEHDGLVTQASAVLRCTIRFPGYHAFELPGCYTEDMEVWDGNPGWFGYGAHHFGDQNKLAQQRFTHHVRPKWINWAGGTLFGCHGSSDGYVQDYVQVDDAYMYNIGSLGDMGATQTGIIFNRPIIDRIGQIAGFGCNMIINDPVITFDQSLGGYGFVPSGDPSLRMQINRGRIAMDTAITRVYGSGYLGNGSGALEFNSCQMVFSGGIGNMTGSYTTITFNGCTLQADDNTPRIPYAAINDNTHGGVVTFRDCAVGGLSDLRVIPNVKLIRTSQSGSTDVYRSGDPRSPVTAGINSPVHSVKSGFIGAAAGAGFGMIAITTAALTTGGGSQGSYALNPSGNGGAPLPPGFVPRGVTSFFHQSRGVIFGEKGLIYDTNLYPSYNSANPGYDPTIAGTTAVASPTQANFTGCVRPNDFYNTVAFLFDDTGGITKYDASNKTAVSVASPVGYKLLGGTVPGILLETNTNEQTMIAWGSADDNTAGGVIYTKDGGQTWATTSLTSHKIKTGCIAGGVYVVAGDNEEFWYATDPAGTWTQFFATDFSLSYRYMAFDASRNMIVFAGGHSDNPFSAKVEMGYIDASVPPAQWKTIRIKSPLPSIGGLLYNSLDRAGITGRATPSIVAYTAHGMVSAESGDIRSGDWLYFRPHLQAKDGGYNYQSALAVNQLVTF